MGARQYAVGLVAMVAMLAALTGSNETRTWGLDFNFQPERTSFMLTAASIHLAFNFERNCPKMNSARRGIF